MDVSQLYMAALRPTGAPIAGESADNLFFGQVELKEWSWDFHNPDVKTRWENIRKDSARLDDERITKKYEAKRAALEQRYQDEDIARLQRIYNEEEALQKKIEASGGEYKSDARSRARKELDDAINRKLGVVDEIITAAKTQSAMQLRREAERKKLAKEEEDEFSPDDNFKFKFSKRVDVATTQLLNCMKAGELLPSCILTMHQASVNTPWSLVITVNKVRLIDYKLKVDTNDTMTDMLEDWECEFESFGYVYQNRPHAGIKSLTAGKESTIAARSATQMTVRTFMMKNVSFW